MRVYTHKTQFKFHLNVFEEIKELNIYILMYMNLSLFIGLFVISSFAFLLKCSDK